MSYGYRVVSFNLESLKAKTLMDRKPVDLQLGSIHEFSGGLYLGSSLEFTQYYLGGTDDHDVILTFEYDPKDIVKGDASPNSEILVRKGTLVDARFENEEIQERFGHLLNPDVNEQRRANDRGDSLSTTSTHKNLAVIRAMDSRVGHFHPMDYVYAIDPGAYYATAKRALRTYENGGKPASKLERSMIKALEHAVTTAIYEGESQQVAYAVVPCGDVYKARNEGEFFYDGSKPAKANALLKINEHGEVMLIPKPHEHELSI